MKAPQFLATHVLGLAVLTGSQAIAAEGSQCTSIADSAARLACYDAALKPRPGLARESAARSAPAPTAADAAPAKQSRFVSMFGLTPKSDHMEADRLGLKATVVAVQMQASGEVITLDNGQVWRITQYLRDPFVETHDAVTINPASLGSFLMARASGGDSVYVKRLR
jgi:hypothetical protein